MTNKIFKSIFFVALSVLLSSLIIITGVLYQYFGNLQEQQLKDELHLAVCATEQLKENYLYDLDSQEYRLTWIASDGDVVFDSHADITTMENHADREEVKEALIYGVGSSKRYSSTLTQQTIYEAKRLNDGSILRISISRATIFSLILGMIQPILIVFIIAIVLSIYLSHRMAKKVVEPLNALNLDKPLENETYDELSPLLHRIHAQHIEINNQIYILKKKQTEFDQITSNMKEALILLDHNGRILSMNPTAQTLFQTNQSCIGEDFFIIDRRQNMRHALEETLSHGHFSFRDQKNGKDYLFDINRIHSDGQHHGIVILAIDITDQVNAEKLRQEFSANVSHELKTPLQSIIGSAELIENGIVKDEDIPHFMKRIHKEASRLVTLIDDIIHLSQLDEGSEMPFEDVSLRVLSEEVVETLYDAAKMKNISLSINGDDGIIHGAKRLLHDIIYNLCDNAIKYNKVDGSVTINIKQNANEIIFSIQDSGIGIASEHHEKIFERFYRVDKSHSKQSGGTGLGLSIVKHAVQYHNGRLLIDSELNKGTTITVIFPQ